MNKKVMSSIISFIITILLICPSADAITAKNKKNNKSKANITAKIKKNNKSKAIITTKIVKTLNYNNNLISVYFKIPVISGLSNTQVQKTINDTINQDIIKFENTIKSKNQSNTRKSIYPFYAALAYKVTYNSKNILSLYINYYSNQYNFPFVERKSYNFDLKTGNTISLYELAGKNTDYMSTIITAINNQEENNGYILNNENNFKYGQISIIQNFYIKNNNYIVIFFNNYEISSFPGIIEFKIPFKSFKKPLITDIPFKKNYVEINKLTEKKSTDAYTYTIEIPQIVNMNNRTIENNLNSLFKNKIYSFKNRLIKSAEESKTAYHKNKYDFEFRPYNFMSTYDIKYNQDNLLSISLTLYEYTGGAHGITEVISFTINTETGKVLTLKDLFEPSYDYKTVINAKIKEAILLNPDYYFDNAIINFKGISDTQKFYIEQENLVIYYDLYEIAPYSSGIREFRIPFSTFTKNFKK